MDELPRFPTKLTPAFLKRVAKVYEANFHGQPTRAVATRFGVKIRMAGEYVKAAELSGFLPATSPGKRRGQ